MKDAVLLIAMVMSFVYAVVSIPGEVRDRKWGQLTYSLVIIAGSALAVTLLFLFPGDA